MSEPRKPLFGPLLYSALLVCVLAGIYSGVEVVSPAARRWMAEHQFRQQLRDGDARGRLAAIRSLEREPANPYRAEVIAALKDPVVEVRLAACRLLAIRGEELPLVVPVLTSAAGEVSDEVRLEVALVLGLLEAVGSRTKQEGPDVAVAGEAHELLFRLLKDRSIQVREAAATSLGKARPDEALRKRLADAAGDADREVRLAIAGSLLKLGGPGDPKAAELLRALAADPELIADRAAALRLAMDASPETRRRVGDALLGLLTTKDSLVLSDVVGCVREGFPPWEVARPAVAKLLDHPESPVRTAAATTMAALDEKLDPAVLAALVRLVADRDASHEERVQALGRVQENAPTSLAGATPDLILQLSDPSQAIRVSAMELLSNIVQDQPARLPTAPPGK